MEERSPEPERNRSIYITGGPGYRAPLRWRLAGAPLIPIMVLAMGLNIPRHPTWTWVMPGLATVLYVVSAVFLWRSRSPKQSALWTFCQAAFAIGALFLIMVPVSM